MGLVAYRNELLVQDDKLADGEDCCCPPPPPPPPPCHPCSSGCHAPDTNGYSSIRITIDFDDSLTVTQSFRHYRCRHVPPECFGWYRTIINQGISGLSGFNGTYDIPYVKYDVFGKLVPATLEDTECGYWFFRDISAYIHTWRTYDQTHEETGETYGCSSNVTHHNKQATITMNVGRPSPNLRTVETGLYWPELKELAYGAPSLKNGTATTTRRFFECEDYPPELEIEDEMITEHEWSTAWQAGWGSPCCQPDWSPTRFNMGLLNRSNFKSEFEGVSGILSRAQTLNANGCTAGQKFGQIQVPAYSDSGTMQTNCQWFSGWQGWFPNPGLNDNMLEWSEFQMRVEAELNV